MVDTPQHTTDTNASLSNQDLQSFARMDTKAPQLSLNLEGINLNDRPGSSGFGGVMSFMDSVVQTPESGFEIVEAHSSDNEHEQTGVKSTKDQYNHSASKHSIASDTVLVQRPDSQSRSPDQKHDPDEVDEAHVARQRHAALNQLDGTSDRRRHDDDSVRAKNQNLRIRNGADEGDDPTTPPVRAQTNNDTNRDGEAEPNPEARTLTLDSQLFVDFDGVHCAIHDDPSVQASPQKRESTGRPLSNFTQYAKSSSTPPKGMVYYPAPVPVQLNRPQPLSKPSRHRQSQMLAQRKSIAVFPAAQPQNQTSNESLNEQDGQYNGEARRSVAHLPPQLRASVFFDHVSTPVHTSGLNDITPAVTLDNLLDAAAETAPAIFTDQPSGTGPASKERSSMIMNRRSIATLGHWASMQPFDGRQTHQRQKSHLSQQSTPEPEPWLDHGEVDPQMLDEAHYNPNDDRIPHPAQIPAETSSLPTTLMAELEARKAEQKSRNRTAASAFPAGMRHTLLELDSVAELVKEQRRQKRTNLAWEDVEQDETEDIPLGLLYKQGVNPTRKSQARMGDDDDVPLGLIVKREMEDNEPLSKRKERLQSSAIPPTHHRIDSSPNIDKKRSTMFLDIPGIGNSQESESADDGEGETLAARKSRLQQSRMSGTSALNLSFDGAEVHLSEQPSLSAPALPASEETLAQRRNRLQTQVGTGSMPQRVERVSRIMEQPQRRPAPMQHRKSMMDILQEQQSIPLHMRTRSQADQYGHGSGLLGAIPGVNTGFGGGGMLGMGGGLAAGVSGCTHNAVGNGAAGGPGGMMMMIPQMQMPMMTPPMGQGYMASGGGGGYLPGMPMTMPMGNMSMGSLGLPTPTYAGALQMQMTHQQQQQHREEKSRDFVERWRSSVE